MNRSSLHHLIHQGIADGHHLGAQLVVSLRGETVIDLALGESAPGVVMTPDTLMVWKSATKPIVAAAAMQCVERGELALHDRVAKHIPAFAAGGKDAITIHHLLTHTAGLRSADFRFPDDPWQSIIDAICAVPLEDGWEPGKTAGYHAMTSWFILGELIQRATGEHLPALLRERLLLPLGMDDCFVGMPPENFARYKDAQRIGTLPRLAGGEDAPDLDPGESHTRAWLTACSPGSNGIGPMRQLVRFYQMLLSAGELDGERVLQPDTVEQMTHRHRDGRFDLTFHHRMDWGLGLLLDKPDRGRMPYGHGRHASAQAFGHGGVQSSAAFADPAHGLAVAAVYAGMPGEQLHQRRIDALLTALYEALGLSRAHPARSGRA